MEERTDLSEAVVDHAVIVGSSLDMLTNAFEAVGLDPVYAGPLANDINHLSQIAFPDGSYFELLSTIEPSQESPWWNDHLKRDGGPCAWALESADIDADTDRVTETEIPVDGPTRYGRERPNGTYFDYELSIIGEGGVATTYPFLIQDHTPRSNRVQWPSPATADTELTGIRYVVTAVENLAEAVDAYRTVYELSEPQVSSSAALGADVAVFDDAPVVLATPTESGWLDSRLDAHGERPAFYVLGSNDLAETVDRFDLDRDGTLFGYDCAWFDHPALSDINTRLAVVG